MTSLRQQMIREMELQRKSPRTIKAYVRGVAQLARHYNRSPDQISIGEIRDFIHHQIVHRQAAFSTVNQQLNAIRLFYRVLLMTAQHVASIQSPLELLRLPTSEEERPERARGPHRDARCQAAE